jgi:hypothetical protein
MRLAKASSFCRVAGRKSRAFSEKPGASVVLVLAAAVVAVGVVKGLSPVVMRWLQLRAGWRAA